MASKVKELPHPFVKWAGGKRQLLSQMETYFPKKYNNYIEPLVGGGAVYFHLKPKQAILIDNNWELVNCYEVIKNDVFELIKSLKKHKNEKNYFYKVRSVDRNPEEFRKWSKVEKASRTIFMNKCCYNGLYRVNSKGQFNAPFGKYINPMFCDEPNLKAVHDILQSASIINASFEICLDHAKKGDFVYFDPPYYPLSQTANFTSYTRENFGKKSQKKLFEIFAQLDSQGCKLMLSNSYNEFILKLYKDFKIVELKAKRAINSDASKRGEIKEVLVLNKKVDDEW
ncbi:MAG: DNA adenine methylase [Promethearchaeota archaeon]